jgi:hypothetical protein
MALSGQNTVAAAGTAEQLGNQECGAPVMVKALAANTGMVVVGNDGAGDVTVANGFQLAAGQQVLFDYVQNLANIWIDSAVNAEGVCWLILEG